MYYRKYFNVQKTIILVINNHLYLIWEVIIMHNGLMDKHIGIVRVHTS